jgi:glycerophosphoryl diester phosphodiesterase
MRLICLLMLCFPLIGFALDLEIQGHRGTRSLRPENTLPAFSKAIEGGATTLEIDILVTADNQLVIYHDFFLNKDLCTYLDGTPITKEVLVRSLTLEEIKTLDAGSKANPDFPAQLLIPGTQVPTLQELFDFINTSSHPNAKKVRLNIELKRDLRFPEWTLPPEKLADAVITQVRRNGFSDRVYYSSIDFEVLAAVRKVDPKAEMGFIFNYQSIDVASILNPDAGLDFLIDMSTLLKVNILSPEHDLLKSTQDVLFLQNKGFRVIPWSVNDPKRWAELIDMGVDGVISDDPNGLVYFIEKGFLPKSTKNLDP